MSTLRIYDSLAKQKVEFTPAVAGKVGIYLCGPTTYDAAHIGHAYSAICWQPNTFPIDLDIFSPLKLRNPLCIQ